MTAHASSAVTLRERLIELGGLVSLLAFPPPSTEQTKVGDQYREVLKQDSIFKIYEASRGRERKDSETAGTRRGVGPRRGVMDVVLDVQIVITLVSSDSQVRPDQTP